MTYRTKISERGQIVLPVELRRAYKISDGSVIRLEPDGEGRIVLHVAKPFDEQLAEIRAYAKKKLQGKSPVTDEEIDEISARAAVERYRRSFE
jgi:AbrB family looped-hinge helix DNA binding protein